jgi:hypothetical protein
VHRRVEGASVRGAAPGRLAGQAGGLGDLRAVEQVAAEPAQRPVGHPQPGLHQLLGVAVSQARSIPAATARGAKPKNTACTTPALAAPSAAARAGK